MTMSPWNEDRRPRILVTGAGGAAAVTLLQALADHADLIAADIDPVAVGLYLVPSQSRVILPRGDAPEFVSSLLKEAIAHDADLVVPTVDSELHNVSAAREEFAAHDIRLLCESPETLEVCLDKFALVQRCRDVVRTPQTLLLNDDLTDQQVAALATPFIVKPRRGAGGRGFEVIHDPAELNSMPRDSSILVQELLPGDEYSIDVLASPDGHVIAAVPRLRDRVDSGIAIAGRTVRDRDLEQFGSAVAQAIGATTVVNVQCRRAADATPALLEVNARFPGTMALTMAAGIDMPALAVDGALGRGLPDRLDFDEVAMVRHWADVPVPIEDYRVTSSSTAVRA